MNDKLFNLISKYALLLSISYAMLWVFNFTKSQFDLSEETMQDFAFQQVASIIFGLILNIIAAFIVGQDIKKYAIKSNYVILATVLYRPLGVFAFLLFVILQERKSVATALPEENTDLNKSETGSL